MGTLCESMGAGAHMIGGPPLSLSTLLAGEQAARQLQRPRCPRANHSPGVLLQTQWVRSSHEAMAPSVSARGALQTLNRLERSTHPCVPPDRSAASRRVRHSGSRRPPAMAALPIEAHFDRVRANLIRCEECNESFFFDFLRHPRYFVAHFKACHLKNVLYRFNGQSEDENQRVRFGPRRKRDAAAWFGQLKSTEKRMISMQDNKWSEIAEKECWVCRACNDQRADLTHAYEPDDLGQRQALLHLRQMHVAAYDAFLRSLPEAPASAEDGAQDAASVASSGAAAAVEAAGVAPIAAALATPLRTTSSSRRVQGQRTIEAERSRLRRLRAPPEARVQEAERSRKRREKMTPAQRHADYERRKRKKKRQEEAERSKQRRSEAPREVREKETLRSRDRRRHASEEQREKEAQRSRERRRKATEEQRARERERCRKRYEAKKQSRSGSTSETSASVPPPASSTPSQPPIEPPRPASSSSAALQSLYASLAEPSRL